MQLRVLSFLTMGLVVASAIVALSQGLYLAAAFSALALGTTAAGWLATGSGHPRETPFSVRLAREVAQGKRLALYDHDTGLLAHWYFSMRFAEECERSTRYERPLSIILFEADGDGEEGEYRLLDWMRTSKRSTDLIGCVTTRRYLMLLPDTDSTGADLALKRLQADVDIAASIAVFPNDGASPAELQAAAESRLGERQLAA